MLKNTGTHLSAALLGYVTLIVILMTLNPFYIVWPDRIAYTFEYDLYNLISNIFLFIPIGFLYRLTTRQRGALIFGALLSLSIETVQIFMPARTSSMVDILANAFGAGVGALIHDLIATRILVNEGTVGRLKLETPLMGLAYLMVPLLWANSFALSNSPGRWVLTGLIGLCIAIIFSELFGHWWDKVDYRMGAYAALATGVWYLIGIGPAILDSTLILMLTLGMMALTAVLTIFPKRSSERRFEHETLVRLFPIFIFYLIALALWPPLRPLTSWHATLGFTDQVTETSLQVLTPRIEYLVGFTVLGYLVAEWRGRSEISLAKDTPRLFLNSLGLALILEVLAGFQTGPGASLVRIVTVVAGAFFGGLIYHLLRAHIRFLLGRQ